MIKPFQLTTRIAVLLQAIVFSCLLSCSESPTDTDPIAGVEKAGLDDPSLSAALKIDQLLDAHLGKQQLKPNPTISDEVFVRRV